MYYYVFEQPHSSADRKVNDKVKMILTDFGIAGEFCVSSPARSAEELVDMGLRKGMGTIVAVGSEDHINRVVSTIKTLERGLHRDIVVGAVPTNKESSLRERLRLQNIQEACEALKYRRFTTVDVGYIEGASYFLLLVGYKRRLEEVTKNSPSRLLEEVCNRAQPIDADGCPGGTRRNLDG